MLKLRGQHGNCTGHRKQTLAADSCHDLHTDDGLFAALLAGAHIENAALAAGVSPRTVYRRLADPEFRERVESAREAIRESILTRLTDAAGDAVSCLWELLSDEYPDIRLKASKALLDSLVRVHSTIPKSTTTVRYSVERSQSE